MAVFKIEYKIRKFETIDGVASSFIPSGDYLSKNVRAETAEDAVQSFLKYQGLKIGELGVLNIYQMIQSNEQRYKNHEESPNRKPGDRQRNNKNIAAKAAEMDPLQK